MIDRSLTIRLVGILVKSPDDTGWGAAWKYSCVKSMKRVTSLRKNEQVFQIIPGEINRR